MSTNRFSEILIKFKLTNKSTTDLNKTELKESIDFLNGFVVGIAILIVIICISLIYILMQIKKIRKPCALQSRNDFSVFIKWEFIKHLSK